MVDVEAHGKIELTLKPSEKIDEVVVEFEVMNALTSPNTHPRMVLRHPVEKRPVAGTAFHYDGKPSFTIEYPAGTTRTGTDRPDQVFAGVTAEGVVFQASMADVPPELPLERMAKNYMESIASGGLGSDLKITANNEMTLKDGTRAYRSEIQWFYIPAGVRLMTQMVSAYQGGKAVWITAHPQTEPERISQIVESLRFDQ